jgi:hypothetical protein
MHLPHLRFVLFALLISIAGTACSKRLNFTAKQIPAWLGTDQIEITNESGMVLGDLDVTLKLKYPDKTEKYDFRWQTWGFGEAKRVPVPRGLKNLQEYQLSGSSFLSLNEQGRRKGPQHFSNTWVVN